jgi:glycosyltransferase involved in cell wall biosynthesis
MPNLTPAVSVIIPTFNRASYLQRSIQSVLNQTFQHIEIIVVDDASTDNTEEIVSQIRDSRISYLKHTTNRGGSAARNTGIQAAKGKFIAFQDSDDEWLSEKLGKQIEILTDSPPKVGVVYTGALRFKAGKKEYIPPSRIHVKEGNIHRELLKENFVTTQAAVVKRECFQKAGLFDETLPRLQDWDLFLRIAKHFEFRYIPEALVHSFFTQDSISAKPKSLIEAFEIILAKYLEDYETDRNLHADQMLRLSNLYLLEHDRETSRKYLVEAIKINHRIDLILALIASLFGIRSLTFYWKVMNTIQRTIKK